MKSIRHHITLGLIATTLATLTACGGGGGTGSNPATGSTVSGVAATGLAIADGQVTFKCVSGSTSAVKTLTDGSYSVDVSKVTLPCVVRVDYVDATTGIPQKLHSLAQVSGTVNITPVTEMVLANLSSTGVAVDVFDKLDVNEIKAYSAERVRAAIQKVKAELSSKGVDVTKLPDDAIGEKLTAANGSTKGDTQDGIFDDLKAKLKDQGKTLKDVETEMKSGHETRGLSTSTGVVGDATAGKAAFDANCKSCHGSRLPDAVNSANIMRAIKQNEGGMGILANSITAVIADNIATYIANGTGGNTNTALKTQTITFAAPGNQTLGVATPVLSATATSGLVVTVTSSTPAVCTVTNNTLTLVAAGSCSLNAVQSGNTAYNAAASVVNTFTVASATGVVLPSQTITFASPGPQKVGTTANLSASSDSGLAITFASTTPSVCTVNGNTLALLTAGNCTITANQAGNSSLAAATLTRTFAVTNSVTAGSAINGKALYASNNCGSCHGAVPAGIVLVAANSPTVLQTAISSNLGGMGRFTALTSLNLADIAAYLATPTI